MSIESKTTGLNLSVLDGVRCWTCLSVIRLHVHYVFGGVFFLSTHWRMLEIYQIPVLGRLFFSVSFHISTFWLISGFLCEHQLTRLQERRGGTLRISDYAVFLLNRMLRLYPLYLLQSIIVFLSVQALDEVPPHDKCQPENLLRSWFFQPFVHEAVKCVGVGWSVVPDMHGYVLVMILFAFVRSKLLKKILLGLGYGLACLQMAAFWLSQDKQAREAMDERGPFGLDYLIERDVISFDAAKIGLRSLYPDFDWENSLTVAIREYNQEMMNNVYLSSIDKHAAAFLLGSLLYLNVQERQDRPKHVWWKLVGAVLLLYLTKASYMFTGLSVYLLLDILLTVNHQSRCNAALQTLFSNRLWKFLTPYTYGMYLFHLMFLFGHTTAVFPQWTKILAQGGDPGEAYGYTFMLVEWMSAVAFALVLSIILHYTIEWPFRYIRKRWLSRSMTVEGKKIE